MSPFARFLLLRLLLVPLTLLVVTATLMLMLTTVRPEVRALQYLPYSIQAQAPEMTQEQLYQAAKDVIRRHHLEDPFPVQYAYWVASLFTHDGGYSPTLKGNVFEALLKRMPLTAELALYSMLLFIPLGVVSGLRAGWRQGGLLDWRFRIVAYVASSLPPFISALLLLGIFYVYLGWFPPGRLGIAMNQATLSPEFPIERLWLIIKAEWFSDFIAKDRSQLIERLDKALLWAMDRKTANQQTCSIRNYF